MSVIKTDDKWTWWDELKLNIECSFPVKHIHDLYHYIRHRLTTKTHLIKTGLENGRWWDTDSRMLYGLMSLLIEYIEKEKAFERIEWNSDEYHKKAYEEMVAIRDWWLNYDNRQKEISDALTVWHDAKFTSGEDDWIEDINREDTLEQKALSDKLHGLEGGLLQEEEEMMIRLIKIRGFLWT